jgi:di/tricarboxylate transporter
VTAAQAAIFAILAATLVLFLINRLRYDLVALLSLLAGLLCGVVPADKAFSGFADPAVVTVVLVLVLSSAIRASGVVERLLRPIAGRLGDTGAQVAVLTTLVVLFSAFMNNIAALALLMPVATQLAERHGRSPSGLLMPLSFASLLGGLVTLIGSPSNLLISAIRRDLSGHEFGLFDFAPVGGGLSALGIVFLAVGWRLLPKGRRGAASAEALFRIEHYVSEALLPAGSPLVGHTVADLEALAEGELRVAAIVRERLRRMIPSPAWTLRPDDVLVLVGDSHALQLALTLGSLKLMSGGQAEEGRVDPELVGAVEAVITADSPMVGVAPADLALAERWGVSLLAIGRPGSPITARLRRVRLAAGDVVVLRGMLDRLPDVLAELGCLPLAGRNLRLVGHPHPWAPSLIMAGAVALTALKLLPITVALLAAACLLLLLRLITLREAYDAISWPVVVLIGALMPVSDALDATGGTGLIADWLSRAAAGLPPVAALGLILLATMLVTPMLNNAATVLVMAPIAAGFARKLGLSLDPFLMAVAVGSSADFLTPIGNQSNTLVMAPGGYRFGDYWRLGLPLSAIVLVAGTVLIALVWPLR